MDFKAGMPGPNRLECDGVRPMKSLKFFIVAGVSKGKRGHHRADARRRRTMMRVLMGVALMAATMAPVVAARAQQSDDRRLCFAGAGVSPEREIESCTAVIEAGLETPQNLAIAFYNRGNAHLNLKDYDHVQSAPTVR
jgi:hypothetical protein